MKISLFRKLLCGLLAIPLVAGGVMLWSGQEAAQLWTGGIMMGLTALLLVVFMLPAKSDQRRQLRAREHVEPRFMPRTRLQ